MWDWIGWIGLDWMVYLRQLGTLEHLAVLIIGLVFCKCGIHNFAKLNKNKIHSFLIKIQALLHMIKLEWTATVPNSALPVFSSILTSFHVSVSGFHASTFSQQLLHSKGHDGPHLCKTIVGRVKATKDEQFIPNKSYSVLKSWH